MEPTDAVPVLELRPPERLAIVDGRGLALSPREASLLAVLLGERGHVVGRRTLYESVWGAPLREQDRSVDVYVHRLRVKLNRVAPEWRFIHTHLGLGYRLEPVHSQVFHKPVTTPQQAVA